MVEQNLALELDIIEMLRLDNAVLGDQYSKPLLCVLDMAHSMNNNRVVQLRYIHFKKLWKFQNESDRKYITAGICALSKC
jgi:hypothetical protein